MHRYIAQLALSGLVLIASSHAAIAAGSGMPWEAPLQRILESIEGPVAKVVAVVTIILTGLSLSFGDMGGASSTRTARSSARCATAVPISTAPPRPSWSPSRRGSTTC
jgi:type IV secretory pathway VirB2 component (pilin)